ncbi:MAG: septum formation initiator, partial [Proteobacteria bacterium]
SSGPVRAHADFHEYDRHIAQVAGPQCLANIRAVTTEVEKRIDAGPASLEHVKKLFQAETVREEIDFLYVIADMASIAIQYGRRDYFCSSLEGAKSIDELLEKYSQVGTEMLTWFGINAEQDSFQGAESLNPLDYISSFGMRSWLYQSCTEYGYWQVADSLESSRSNRITLDYHNRVCERLFGITTPVDDQKTNQLFLEPLFAPSTSHIFFTNGADDPWSVLSILPGSVESLKNPNLNYLLLNGHAHCDDLGQKIPEADDQFTLLLDRWL